MPIFRRRRDRHTGSPATLTELTSSELFARYEWLTAALDDGPAAPSRNAELDALAAEILRRDPDNAAFWYDRGMYAKWRRDWTASVEYNTAALDLLPSADRSDEPAAWNLGIAASALHDWVTARRAWEEFGITITDGAPRASPIDADLGLAPVRLNADPRFVGEEPLLIDGRTWDTEVVWGAATVRSAPGRSTTRTSVSSTRSTCGFGRTWGGRGLDPRRPPALPCLQPGTSAPGGPRARSRSGPGLRADGGTRRRPRAGPEDPRTMGESRDVSVPQ